MCFQNRVQMVQVFRRFNALTVEMAAVVMLSWRSGAFGACSSVVFAPSKIDSQTTAGRAHNVFSLLLCILTTSLERIGQPFAIVPCPTLRTALHPAFTEMCVRPFKT